nr:MAG TPA: bacteriocin [Bacteriophage sp.]
MLLLRARAILLNAALSAGIGFALSWITKKFVEYSQRIDTAATKSKEAADAAQSTTSSLKDLVSAYEELGDKSSWDTEDFDQAKDIQAEILDLAKEQGTLDEGKLGKLDLQNGKYEEQLGLLQDITAEQLEASRYELTQNKDAQGDKLVDTAKKNNRTHYLTVWSAPEMDMGDQIKNAGIDVFNKFGGYGPDKLNDADSIVDYYNEVGKALKYIIDNTTEAERAAGGTYHSLYQFLLDEQTALRDDVDSYNDSTDAINNNTNARRKLQAVDFWSDGKSNGMDVSFTFDKVNSAVQTLEDTIDGFDASKLNELLWGTNEGLSDEQAQALANLRKALTDMDFSADTNGVNAFIQALVQVGIVAQSSANGVDALAAGAQKMEDISSKMDEIQSAYKASTSAMEEYNQYGYMSLDSLQSLLTMNTEYLNCLELVNGKLQINKQSYAELLAAEYAEAAATILSNAQHEVANLTADDTAESTDDLKEKTEAEKTALENLLPALKNATAATATYSAAQEFANEVEKAGERGVDPAKLEEITNRTNTQLSLLYTNMNAALKGGRALTNQLNGFGSSSKNAGKSSSTTSKSVADLSSAFDTLTKAMKEYNQYGYISADTMKSLIGVDDKFTACLTEQNGKLELNTAKFRTFVRAQLEEANAANDGGKSASEMKKILDWLNSSVDSETISFEQLTDAIKGYGTAMDEAKEKTDAIKSAFSGLYDIQQKIKNSQFGVGDLDATESKIESILQLSKFFGDNKDLMDNLVDKNGNINLNTEAFKKATLDELDKRIKAANETGGAAATALANSLSSDKANIESGKISVSDYLVGLGTDLERVNTELDKYQTNWSTLKDAMDEWNTTGQLTQDTMQKLQELPEEFSNLLTYDEDGNAKIDVKALRQSYVDKLSAFAKEFEGSPIGIQVQAMIDDVREPTPEEYKALAEKTVKYQKALAQYTKKMSAIDSNKDLSEDEALQQKAEVQKELDEAIEEALLEVQETDAQVTTKLKKHWDGVEKVIEEFKSALSDAKAVLSSFLSLLSTLNDKSNNDLKIWGDTMNKVIDKRIEALNKQKEALEENNEATERAIELSKAQDALARAQQQRTTRVYTENGYEWQANAEDVRTAREDLADKQREWNNKDAEKAIDDQIKKYNEFKDKLSEVMDDIGKSWKDYQKELEYTAQIQKMTLTQMEGILDDYHNKIIASLNTGSAITGIQNLITNLESLINTLTKVNNLYSMFKTGEYKDLGTKGLWDTIKGFFNKGKSENVNKSFKDTFNAAKKAFNAGKKQLTDTATTGATDVINAMINQIKTSGNGLIETFGGIWDKIKVGAQSLFRGSGSGGGIISTFVNGFKAIGNAVSKSKIGSTILGGIGKVGTTLLSGGGKLLAGAGKLIGTAGSALAAAGPYAIPIAAAAGLGIYGAAKNFKHQKEIWSNKEDGFGKKAIKSVATFFWDISPIGAIVNLCKDISGKSKKTAENTKDTADSSSETAENTKHSATNLTINATQIVSKEENKATDETDKKNDATANEDKTVKTVATTLTGAGLGAAAGMAIGGPAGALIGTLLGGFAGFFFGRHANGLKSSKTNHFANVDERGSELIVRKPASGRYTYLETGDGVVPADITSRLFEMGGNPDKWFSDQLAKHGSASMVQSRDAGGISLSIGDVNVNNPVGDSDALARELVNRLPNKVVQELNRR